MSQLWQLKALMKKNYILMKRSCCASICEIFFPIILMILISLVRRAITIKDYSFDGNEFDFIKKNSTSLVNIQDLKMTNNQNKMLATWNNLTFIYPLSICTSRPTIAIVGNKDNDLLKKLTTNLYNLNPKIFFPNTTINISFKYFNNESDMFVYVKSDIYGADKTDNPELCFGINFSKNSETDYTYNLSYFDSIIRNANNDVPSTLKKSLDPFQIGPDISSYSKWMNSGYLYMMKLINTLILQSVTNNPTANINFAVLNQKFNSSYQDPFGNFLGFMLPFFLVIAYICPMCLLVFRMVKEKESRAKEGMKIMGMQDLVYFLSYFLQFLIINTFTSILNTFILTRILKNIGFIYIFGFIWLYGMNIFSLGYFFQAIMDKTRIAMIVSILIYFIMFFVSAAVTSEDVTNSPKMLMSLLPPTALQLGISVLAKFETSFIKFSYSNVSYVFNNYSVANMYSMFILNFFIYLFLGFYLENVLPHQFGITKPYYFLCQKSYWCKKSNNVNNIVEMATKKLNVNESKTELKADNNGKNGNDERDHFEDESKYDNLVKSGDCLRIINLQKKFGEKKKALDGLNLNFYKNEVFALLGHNGAGKSTAISILCGLYEADQGEAIFDNKNVLETNNVANFRKKLGICPQHDVLFDNLTVREHLEMFCVFKGVETNLIESEVLKAMEEMCIQDKADFQANGLSGGQKRKLSIALALIGGSEVVFLDEPSSGMDITSRRQLWDILKKCTNNRIIVLTTHYMEEAAVLGNRIGILTNGKLKCCGGLLFLIDRYGQYISLNIIKHPDAIDTEIIKFITDKIPDVQYEILSEEILFRIPKSNDMSFKDFFSELDYNMNNLRIKTYGASMPTLEDVYLNVASHKDLNAIVVSKPKKNSERFEEKINNIGNKIEIEDSNNINNKNDFKHNIMVNYDEYDASKNPKISWFGKFSIDLNSSLKKRLIQIIRDKKSFMLEIICPILLVLIGLGVSSVEFIKDSPTLKIDLNLLGKAQKIKINSKVYYDGTNLPSSFFDLHQNATVETVDFDFSKNDFTNNLILYNNLISPLNYTSDIDSYGSYLITSLDNLNYKYEFLVLANSQAMNSPIIYTQLMMNKIISNAANKNININFNNSPFPLTLKSRNQGKQRNSSNLVFFISIAFALIPANFITIIIKERELNTKHLQIISGISHLSYWFSNFIFELIKYYFTGGICLLLILAFDSYSDYLYVLYLLYGFSMVSFTYMVSFMFKLESTAQNFIILINFLFGALGGTIILVLRILEDTVSIGRGLAFIFRFVPSFAFSYGYNQLLSIKLIYSVDYPLSFMKMTVEPISIDYVGMDIIFLAFEFFIYTLILIVSELTNNKLFFGEIESSKTEVTNVNDTVVLKEIEKANIEEEEKSLIYSVKVKNLEKTYTDLCCGGKPFKAIDKLSFCLEYGECFALLGVNGAGKTTTFKTLTCEHLPTRGSIYINGKDITKNFDEIRSYIGYCPQFDAIFDYMTVNENLEFYAKIKGIGYSNIPNIIDSLISELKLSRYKHDISGNLSGGNKRKLSVGIAMIGNPPIILLDEPSNGMDPEARRFMWSVIHKISSKSKKSTVILTTHSMEEAETLCRRMGIMVAGQFKCLGTSQYIKDKYGYGFEIDIRIMNIPDRELLQKLNLCSMDQRKSNYTNLLTDNNLGKNLKEEIETKGKISIYKVLNWLYYTESALMCLSQIFIHFKNIFITEFLDNNFKIKVKKNTDNKLTIGFLFGLLEDQKKKCNLTEYSISQTSLEQIFNKFALEANEEDKNALKGGAHKEILVSEDLLRLLSIIN